MEDRKWPPLIVYRWVYGVLLAVMALASIRLLPFTYSEGDVALNVLSFLRTGHVVSTFTPDTYPAMVGLGYRVAGVKGILLIQVLLYVLLGWSVLWLMRFFVRNARMAYVGALCVMLDPDLLSGVPKLWDTELTCLVMAAFTALCLYASEGRSEPGLHDGRPGWLRSGWMLAGIAVVWGFGASARPNLLLLAFPCAYMLWAGYGRGWVVRFAGIAAGAAVVFAVTLTLAHGSLYFPQNGPYNLFAGANPYTEATLLREYNAEPSIDPALAALGMSNRDHHDLALSATYRAEGMQFIRKHTGRWVWLSVIKLFTLLRPDTKAHRLASAAGLVRLLTSMCVVVWLGALVVGKRLSRADKIVIAIVCAYIVPFMVTNADPRFRVPLDVVMLAHAVALLLGRFVAGAREGVAAEPLPSAGLAAADTL